MMEAENLARLWECQTPSLGGKSSELHPSSSSGETLTKKELSCPPAASVELIRHSLMRRADEEKSSFVPPIDIEQADGIASKDLLSWLDFDSVEEYIPSDKEKKKGVKRTANIVPLIHDFEEAELKEASSLIEEEAQYLRRAMGHEEDNKVEVHNTVEVPEPVSMMMDVGVFNDVKLNNDVIRSLEKDTQTDPEVDCDQNVGDTINSDGNAEEAVQSDNIEMVSSSEKESVGGEGHSTSGIVGKEATLDGDVMPVRNPLWKRIKSYITSFDRS